MRVSNFLIFVILFTLSFSNGFAQATVSQFTLKNGMNVLVKEDNSSPVVVHQVWYKTGSNNEVNGTTGIAHMLEHMMFKGTKKVKKGEFSKIISRIGGRENAFTSRDYTAYFQILGKQHLEKAMQLEADRMVNLILDKKEFLKERDVVAEERRFRVEDKPISKLNEQFMAMAFMNSSLHNPVIGWMNDIKNYSVEDARKWYVKWYAPNNATLVVVGDVNTKKVKQLAEKYYGGLASKKIILPKSQTEIKQVGQRRLTLKDSTKLPQIMMGFHVPSLPSAKNDKEKKEVYALSILASILGGGDSSRLSKILIRKEKIALSADAYMDELSKFPSIFVLNGTPVKGKNLKDVEEALWQQIQTLKSDKIKNTEFKMILAQSEASYIYQQDSAMGQAMLLGLLVSVNLPSDTLDNWVHNLRKVTPQQIQDVAKKYLVRENMTVGILLQKDKKENSK